MIIFAVLAVIAMILAATVIIMKIFLFFTAAVIAGIYALTYIVMDAVIGDTHPTLTIIGTAVVGTLIIFVLGLIIDKKDKAKDLDVEETISRNYIAEEQTPQKNKANLDAPCPCGSGRRFKNCHGLI